MNIDQAIERKIFKVIDEVIQNASVKISRETSLIGENGILDSMQLVEVCIKLEDLASELGFEFNWTTSEAFSQKNSHFKNAGTLIDMFCQQMEAQQ